MTKEDGGGLEGLVAAIQRIGGKPSHVRIPADRIDMALSLGLEVEIVIEVESPRERHGDGL